MYRADPEKAAFDLPNVKAGKAWNKMADMTLYIGD
jgi:hypothetical protein